MNKTWKILLSVMAGVDAVIYMVTPIILSVVWITLRGLDDYGTALFFALGLIATTFRAIKIGWLKKKW